jgi:PhnB protein
MKLNPYLHFNGNCEEAVNFYGKALGAKIGMLMRYGEAPADNPCSQGMEKKVMHARITIGDNVIMASDSPPEHAQVPAGFSVSLNVDSIEEAERIYQALSEKGTVFMPLGETFWAQRFAMFKDRFGTPWMINCEKQG